jgi:hypothetical protein
MDHFEVFTMSKKRRRQTAEELMTELAKDPEFVRMRAAKDERSRLRKERLDAIERPILASLAEVGFAADSIEDLVKKFVPLPEAAVDMLLRCLRECHEDRIQESLVRALAATRIPFNGQALVDCFESTSDEGLRFAILNTIALARPNSIDDWIQKILQNEYRRKQLTDLGYKPRETGSR